jgi:hypothetical protein
MRTTLASVKGELVFLHKRYWEMRTCIPTQKVWENENKYSYPEGVGNENRYSYPEGMGK